MPDTDVLPETASQRAPRGSAPLRTLVVLARNPDGLAQKAIAAEAGLKLRSVHQHVKVLREKDILQVVGHRTCWGPGAGVVLAVSVGTEHMNAGLVTADGEMRLQARGERCRGQLKQDPARLFERLRELALRLLEEGLREPSLTVDGRIPLLGAASAWPFALNRGLVPRGSSEDHPDWQRSPVSTRMATALGGLFVNEILVDALNDANATAIAVGFDRLKDPVGRSKRTHSELIVALRLGVRLGCGTLHLPAYDASGPPEFARTRLMVGSDGFAGAFGHLPVADATVELINRESTAAGLIGPLDPAWRCSCSARGHLEPLASAEGIAKRFDGTDVEFSPDEPLANQIDALIKAGDPRITAALYDTGRLLGQALASPVLMLDPAEVVFAGYLTYPKVLEGAEHELEAWIDQAPNTTEFDELSTAAADVVQRRGAALAIFRERIYRRLPALLDDQGRSELLHMFGSAELEAMAAGSAIDTP